MFDGQIKLTEKCSKQKEDGVPSLDLSVNQKPFLAVESTQLLWNTTSTPCLVLGAGWADLSDLQNFTLTKYYVKNDLN